MIAIKEYKIEYLNTPFAFKVYKEEPTLEDIKNCNCINRDLKYYRVECLFGGEVLFTFYSNIESSNVTKGQEWRLNKFLSERMVVGGERREIRRV